MNKVILMGRLTKDPEVRYSQAATPVAVAKYGIAVRRQFSKQGEPDVDFFNVVAFGKAGEFVDKYFKKGQMIAIIGRLKVDTWEDDSNIKRTSYVIVAEEQHFAGSKGDNQQAQQTGGNAQQSQNSYQIVEDDDLPF